MRRMAVGLLAAAGIAVAVPAHAKGFCYVVYRGGYVASAPAYVFSDYPYAPRSDPYAPRYRYGRSFVGVRTSHPNAGRHPDYRSARISGEVYQTQTSALVGHDRHSRFVTSQR